MRAPSWLVLDHVLSNNMRGGRRGRGGAGRRRVTVRDEPSGPVANRSRAA